uniref:Uncharacterized protein n=1 Tax=Pithovirus LCPAC103 TaxID=2506588 RepID=A0A481Z5M3_9VIRU|nr:MAG: uncharacterized protein LCPAC103_01000 [Pithovirus LCPAC103]
MLSRSTFDPNEYKSLKVKDNPTKSRSLEIVKKGKHRALKFDRDEIDNVLGNMRKHSAYRIQDLRGDLKKQYDLIVRLVDLLYDTDGYQNLYDLVKKHFGDIDNAKPGTLCAYFAGCLISSNQGKGDKCGVLCAGSLPLPKSITKGKCGETVILCSYNDDHRRYHFRVLSASNAKPEAIIYMDSGKSGTFRGFTKHEKERLRGMGIKRVSINWIKDGKTDHGKINPKIDLDRIQEFDGNSGSSSDDDNDTNLTALWVILIAFVIIIIILFLANSK